MNDPEAAVVEQPGETGPSTPGPVLSSRLPSRLQGSTRAAVVGLLTVNVLPLLGVLVLGWNLHALLVLYWLESAVIGAFNVPKILYAHGTETAESRRKAQRIKSNGRSVTLPDAPDEVPDRPRVRPENWPVARFFIGNYGIFWVVHGVFVFVVPIFGDGTGFLTLASVPTLALGVVATVVSHGTSYRSNYLAGEWRTVSPGQRMNAPYRRVLVLHLTVVLGGFFVGSAGAPLGMLAVMVVVKTALDLRGHLNEHRRDSGSRGRERGSGAT